MEKNTGGDFQTTLSEACLALNAKCHTSIERMIKEDAANPHQIENIDVDKFITCYKCKKTGNYCGPGVSALDVATY